MNKRQLKKLLALIAAVGCMGVLPSYQKAPLETKTNPAKLIVAQTKKSDTALLLCTFGSTYKESLAVYDSIVKDFQKEFPNVDVYLSFTSRICINRSKAATGIERYGIDQWLRALGEAGYRRLAVQSLHLIPGEEYLSLMNTDLKKYFMLQWHPEVEVLKGTNLLANKEDNIVVAKALYQHYKPQLDDPKSVVLLMGHGNSDENYSANDKFTEMEQALLSLTPNRNIFMGTVDYGKMLFWPKEGEKNPQKRITDPEVVKRDYPTSVYAKLMSYCAANSLQPKDLKVYIAPFMVISGNHAHQDLWGLEAIAEGKGLDEVELNTNEYSWRERLKKAGFDVQESFETHPIAEAGTKHGIKEGCNIQALGNYPEIRKIWVKHLRELWDADAWESGKDYQ